MMRFSIDQPPATAPHRPAVRAGVARVFNGYATETPLGRVVVHAWPHRPMAHARQLARRVRRDPAGYLWAVRCSDAPGVDVRPPLAAPGTVAAAANEPTVTASAPAAAVALAAV